jgi:hypothetical protein
VFAIAAMVYLLSITVEEIEGDRLKKMKSSRESGEEYRAVADTSDGRRQPSRCSVGAVNRAGGCLVDIHDTALRCIR